MCTNCGAIPVVERRVAIGNEGCIIVAYKDEEKPIEGTDGHTIKVMLKNTYGGITNSHSNVYLHNPTFGTGPYYSALPGTVEVTNGSAVIRSTEPLEEKLDAGDVLLFGVHEGETKVEYRVLRVESDAGRHRVAQK